MGHNSIENYYRTIFGMVQHHKWDLTAIELLMPWELEIYAKMLMAHVKEENEKAKKDESAMKMQTSSQNFKAPHIPTPAIPKMK